MRCLLCTNCRNRPLRFTLIELLVVVVIILILASMLMPVLDHARNAGYRVACMNNLKQLQIGHTTYTFDNDKFFMDPDNSDANKWAGLADSEAAIRSGVLINYVSSVESFYCEADETHLFRSYSVNTAVGNNQTHVTTTPPALRFNRVTESASGVYTFIEESDPRISGGGATNQNAFYTQPGAYTLWSGGDWPAAYHISGYNLAFLDGHVQHVTMTKQSIALSLSGAAGVGTLTVGANNEDRERLYKWQNVN